MICLSVSLDQFRPWSFGADWIIRDTGNGPGMMVQVMTPLGIHGARLAGRWKNILTPPISQRILSGTQRQNQVGELDMSQNLEEGQHSAYTMEPHKTKSLNMEKLMPETKEYFLSQ